MNDPKILSRPDMSAAAVEARVAQNLAAFERHAPQLHARLANMNHTATQLSADEAGRLDIVFGEGALYRADAIDYANTQLAEYFAEPERVYISMKTADKLLGLAGEFARWSVAYPETHGIALEQVRTGGDAGYMFVYGVGLGLHLAPLVAHAGCRDLVLIEPNLEHIRHSLSTIDWAEIFMAIHGAGGSVYFIFERDIDAISSRIREVVRETGTAFLDGSYVYQHLGSGVLNGAHQAFHDDFALHIYGLGFYEDEVVMMSNAVSNLGRGTTKVIASPLPVRDTPVMICGSGPSIDRDMDFIIANRENVILVSLGSSLRALRANGLTPDYHVELENEAANARNVRNAVEEFGKPEGTTLIASTSVRPEVCRYFDDRVFYFRDRVSSTMLLSSGADPLGACGPSVANAALITLLYMGFRKLYLFGVDMGTRERDTYHASATYIGLGKAPEWGGENRFEVPANFGGTAYTEGILNWSRFTFENVVRLHRDLDCINCSDGVRIAHATPQLSRLVTFPQGRLDRAKVKARVAEGLPNYSDSHCQSLWRREQLERHAGAVFGRVNDILKGADPAGDMAWARDLYEETRYAEVITTEPPTRVFLFGTTVLLLASMIWVEGRITDPESRIEYRRAALAELESLFARMARRYTRLLDDVDAFFDGTREELEAFKEDVA
ncbi:MAG: 6-hydroxymethylpterin diphosphokinase MptE-like protein [Alphaproteobacteria bacterium]